MDDKAHATSHGIDALIARLHGDGVQSGQREAERLLAEARLAAARLVDQGRAEAEALRTQARAAADAERAAVVHAFELARRDALLRLKDDLCEQLAARLRRLVAEAIAQPGLLQQVLLVVAAGEPLPPNVDELLAQAVRSLLDEDGIDTARGIRIRLADGNAQIELTDEALSDLLASHLLPRFRARLDASHSA